MPALRQQLRRWLHKKTGQRIRAIYKRYYRRDGQGHLTWNAGSTRRQPSTCFSVG
jgi:hypothetical protein